jgi:hypothetical protein
MSNRRTAPTPPPLNRLPLVHASEQVSHWLEHYWHKIQLPDDQRKRLAVTQSRQEFAEWTGRRLNSMALGCYCYMPLGTSEPIAADRSVAPELVEVATEARTASPLPATSLQMALPGFAEPSSNAAPPAALVADYRHLIFVEPDLLELGIEVTVAHELIHLADRVQGRPRKHRCHGHDSISNDEAAITGQDPELLRVLLAEETKRREDALRRLRPYRYYYYCPNCKRVYPRVRRYTRLVSCGRCCKTYNPTFLLRLRLQPDGPDVEQHVEADEQPDALTG